MQKISYKDMPKISKVTEGVSSYRKNTRVKPFMADIKGKQTKSGDRVSVSGNFTINKKSK
jgi:hypothetical protein